MGDGKSMIGVGIPGLKIILFISTTVLFLLGLAAIIIGGVSLGGVHSPRLGSALKVPGIAIALIIMGSVVLLLSLFGKLGTIRVSKPLLGIFFAVLLLITLIELGIGIAAYTLADQPTVEHEVSKYWKSFDSKVHRTVQESFQCCGLHGTPDNPVACSIAGVGHGCLVPFSKWLVAKIETLDIIAIISAVLQVVILTFTMLLIKAAAYIHDDSTMPLLSSRVVIVS